MGRESGHTDGQGWPGGGAWWRTRGSRVCLAICRQSGWDCRQPRGRGQLPSWWSSLPPSWPKGQRPGSSAGVRAADWESANRGLWASPLGPACHPTPTTSTHAASVPPEVPLGRVSFRQPGGDGSSTQPLAPQWFQDAGSVEDRDHVASWLPQAQGPGSVHPGPSSRCGGPLCNRSCCPALGARQTSVRTFLPSGGP